MSDYFIRFANCMAVKGAKRAIIYDLLQESFEFVPNDLVSILEACEDTPLPKLHAAYDEESQQIIQE